MEEEDARKVFAQEIQGSRWISSVQQSQPRTAQERWLGLHCPVKLNQIISCICQQQ